MEKSTKKIRSWQDSNLQSPDPKSGALSIRPHDHSYQSSDAEPSEYVVLQTRLQCVSWFAAAASLDHNIISNVGFYKSDGV